MVKIINDVGIPLYVQTKEIVDVSEFNGFGDSSLRIKMRNGHSFIAKDNDKTLQNTIYEQLKQDGIVRSRQQ